jgi:hypothetical protein
MRAFILFLSCMWHFYGEAFSQDDLSNNPDLIQKYLCNVIPSLALSVNEERIKQQISIIEHQIKFPEKSLEEITEKMLQSVKKIHEKDYKVAYENFTQEISCENLGSFLDSHAQLNEDQKILYLSFYAIFFIEKSSLSINKKRYFNAIILTSLSREFLQSYNANSRPYPSCHQIFNCLLADSEALLNLINYEIKNSLQKGHEEIKEVESSSEINTNPHLSKKRQLLATNISCEYLAKSKKSANSKIDSFDVIMGSNLFNADEINNICRKHNLCDTSNAFPPVVSFFQYFHCLKKKYDLHSKKIDRSFERLYEKMTSEKYKKIKDSLIDNNDSIFNHKIRIFIDYFSICLLVGEDALFEIEAGLYCLSEGGLPFGMFTSNYSTHHDKFITPISNFIHDEQHAIDSIYDSVARNLDSKKEAKMYSCFKNMCKNIYNVINAKFDQPEKNLAFFVLYYLLRESYYSCSCLYDKDNLCVKNLHGLTLVIKEAKYFFNASKDRDTFRYDYADYASMVATWFPSLKDIIYPPHESYPSEIETKPELQFSLGNFYIIMNMLFSWLETSLKKSVGE